MTTGLCSDTFVWPLHVVITSCCAARFEFYHDIAAICTDKV